MTERHAPVEHRVDVLVIGGGLAGLTAAIRARASGMTVLVADKGTVGWSGQAGMSGGFAWVVPPGEDPDDFVGWIAAKGEYLSDQLGAQAVAERSYHAICELVRWGIPFDRDDHGRPKVVRFDFLPPPISGTPFTPVDILRSLAKLARERGVRILDKTSLVEPLVDDGQVVGAAGFDVLSATPVVVFAGATILASGSCDYRGERLYRSSTGEGLRFAWRAGAELRNAEFGNLYCPKMKIWDGPFRGPLLRYLRNVKGERLYDLYQYPSAGEELGILLLGMARELGEGRGPCTIEFSEFSEAEDVLRALGEHPLNPQRLIAKIAARDSSEWPSNQPVTLAFVGKLSPVSVDHGYRTSVAGLFAIGDVSHMGSSFEGALPGSLLPGMGITYAVVSALEASARIAREALIPTRSDASVSGSCVQSVLSALGRSSGASPDELIRAVQRIMCPVGANMIRSRVRLDSMRSCLLDLGGAARDLAALDGHGLAKCHEARSILLSAELTTQAAWLRAESRGSHLREDFPEPDDTTWLRWIVLRARDEEVEHEFVPVPIDRYPHPVGSRPSPWGRYRERRPRRSAPPKTRRSVMPASNLDLEWLCLRDLEDRRVALEQHRGLVVVLVAGYRRAAEECTRWSSTLERHLGGTAGVVLYRVAVVRIPTFIPRTLVKRPLRREQGASPFLVAWNEQERASLPFGEDALPHVLVFARDGVLHLHAAELFSKRMLARICAIAGQQP